jgi:hypothetical protein
MEDVSLGRKERKRERRKNKRSKKTIPEEEDNAQIQMVELTSSQA